jgi:hypothetical protein
MAMNGRHIPAAGLLIAAMSLADPARAEDEGAAYARVRHLEDAMTIARAAEGEIFEASLNAPILPGDRGWTGESRAEIELADGSLLWLDEWTRAGFRSLADVGLAYGERNLIVLEEGAMRISVDEPRDEAQAFQIDTEAGTVYILSGGEFRIEAGGGLTTLSSLSGVAELSGDAGSIMVRSGERSSVGSGRTPSEPRHFNTARLDDFDRYCEERTLAYLRRDEEAIPAGVSEEVPVEVHHYIHELSIYGRWYSVPSYGWVWRPAYHGAWSPYHDGYWTWCHSGWTWVSYEPWGWAPYHYGRWDHVADVGWIWIPGRQWSGAWVSFAVGPTYVGWTPLNYYNRPVFHDAQFVTRVSVRGSELQTRGWRFAPYDQFATRDRARVATRGQPVPGDSEAVITRSLPRFDRTAAAMRPDPAPALIDSVRAARSPLPIAVDTDGKEIPFRRLERPAAARTDPARRPGVQPGRSPAAAPGTTVGVPALRRRRAPLAPGARPGDEAGAPAAGGDGLRAAPRALGLTLEQQGGPRPDGEAKPAQPGEGEPAAGERSGSPPQKQGGHAVEKLFRGSRPRPTPLVEEATPPANGPRKPAERQRGKGGEARAKPDGGKGEPAGGSTSERPEETGRKPSDRPPETAKEPAEKKEESSKQKSDGDPKESSDRSSGGGRSDRRSSRRG